MENMVMGNPFRKTSPCYVVFNPVWSNALAVRLEPTSDLSGSLKKIEAVFNKFNPAYPFQYSFVDDKFNKRYAAINLIHKLVNVFMILAFIITGLGLFGLTAMTAQRRTKEIGIRKAMGASLAQLVGLLTQEFLWLVGIAFALIAPISIWFLTKHLENYPYHIDFPWVALILAGLVQLLFVILVVGSQSLKAALANPTKSLRSE
jgi:ABC-type antimicrobial peptide transport system permease subunit